MIAIISEISVNNVISENKEIPWLLPEGLSQFKEITEDSVIVMGWNTWVSLGEKPISNRINVIITRGNKYVKREKNVKVMHSPQEVLDFNFGKKDIYIIGGASIYASFLSAAKYMYITRVFLEIEGTNVIHFPTYNKEKWKKIGKSTMLQSCCGPMYQFEEYKQI